MPVSDRVGEYELIRPIGSGGMAEVWMGRRTSVGGATKSVAVKFIASGKGDSERHREMFVSEARLSMMLSHSNVIQVFDVGDDAGRLYMVMEWVDGMNLSQLLHLHRTAEVLPTFSLVGFVIGEVLRGLAYAHNLFHEGRQITVVHRDISPQNVLVSVSGEVKLLDFGVARLAQEETSGIHIKGKLRYMAPEHLGGNSKAPTVDLYGAGAILHELLSGEKFRAGADEVSLYNQILGGQTPPLTRADVPAQLEQLRDRLLDPDEHRRVQTAEEALELLEQWPGYRSAAGELSRTVRSYMGVEAPRSGIHVQPAQSRPIDVLAATARPTSPTSTWSGADGTSPAPSGSDPSITPVPMPTAHSGPMMARPPSATRSAAVLLLGAAVGIGIAIGGVAFFMSGDESSEVEPATVASAESVAGQPTAGDKAPEDSREQVVDEPVGNGASEHAAAAGQGGDQAQGGEETPPEPVDPEAEAGSEAEADGDSAPESPPADEVDSPKPKRSSRRNRKGDKKKPSKSDPVAVAADPKPTEKASPATVTFKLKSPLRLAYIRVDGGSSVAVEPIRKKKIGAGKHRIDWRKSPDSPWISGGGFDFTSGRSYTIRIANSGPRLE